MSSRIDYPLDNALRDLEKFFKAHIKDKNSRESLLDYLETCKKSNKLGFRYLHEALMKYRRDFSDYFEYSESEKQMIDDLFYFWE